MVASNPGASPIHTDFFEPISAMAQSLPVEAILERIDAIMECRRALATNVAPQLALEALMVSLVHL